MQPAYRNDSCRAFSKNGCQWCTRQPCHLGKTKQKTLLPGWLDFIETLPMIYLVVKTNKKETIKRNLWNNTMKDHMLWHIASWQGNRPHVIVKLNWTERAIHKLIIIRWSPLQSLIIAAVTKNEYDKLYCKIMQFDWFLLMI